MHYIYLSPHLDDAIFSCGGIIWEQIQQGDQVGIWTLFSGDSPSENLSPFAKLLHARWGEDQNPYLARRKEDISACELLHVSHLHLDYLDCIYRRLPETGEPLIMQDLDLFNHGSAEEGLIEKIRTDLAERLTQESTLVAPLGVGAHVDHTIARTAAERLGRSLYYYPDFPYAALPGNSIEPYLPLQVTPFKIEISQAGMQAWQNGIAAYKSQISSFWQSLEEMKEKVQVYAKSPLACMLWQKSNP